jgi:hypothetical protein
MISWVSSVWAWFTPLISSVVSSKLHGAERERVGRIASTYMYKIPTDATHSLGIGGCGAMGTIPDTRGRNTNTHTTQTHEHTYNTKRRGENKKTKRLYKGGDWSSLLPRHTRNILPPPCLGSLRQILASASLPRRCIAHLPPLLPIQPQHHTMPPANCLHGGVWASVAIALLAAVVVCDSIALDGMLG